MQHISFFADVLHMGAGFRLILNSCINLLNHRARESSHGTSVSNSQSELDLLEDTGTRIDINCYPKKIIEVSKFKIQDVSSCPSSE